MFLETIDVCIHESPFCSLFVLYGVRVGGWVGV